MIRLVAAAHFAFILFVAFGGFLVLRWRKVAWVHVPAVLWGIFIEIFPRTCPLTVVENELRGRAAYHEDFITHDLFRVIYPTELTRNLELALAAFVVLINGAIYWRAFVSENSSTGRDRKT